MARFVEQLPEGGSFIGNAALQGAIAHAQLFGDHEEVGPTAGQQSLQHPLHLLKDAPFRSPILQFMFAQDRLLLPDWAMLSGFVGATLVLSYTVWRIIEIPGRAMIKRALIPSDESLSFPARSRAAS